MSTKSRRLALTGGIALALACGTASGALGQESSAFDASTMVRVRIPFGPGTEERARTVSVVSAARLKPQIEAPSPMPSPQYPVLEAGLAFNGDAFVNVAASRVLRAVRAAGPSETRARRVGGRLPTPLASPTPP